MTTSFAASPSHTGFRARAAILGGLLVLSMAMPAAAAAAPLSKTYWITGAEYSATSTVGSFAGTASGSKGDAATWQAVVEHTPLTTSAAITGGYARVLTSNLVSIRGDFSGGSVALIYEAAGCSTQQYAVTGSLDNVTRSDTGRVGTGTFNATLTHYRVWIFGSCITYSATVSGTIGLKV